MKPLIVSIVGTEPMSVLLTKIADLEQKTEPVKKIGQVKTAADELNMEMVTGDKFINQPVQDVFKKPADHDPEEEFGAVLTVTSKQITQGETVKVYVRII